MGLRSGGRGLDAREGKERGEREGGKEGGSERPLKLAKGKWHRSAGIEKGWSGKRL